jgi:hypothetical protein
MKRKFRNIFLCFIVGISIVIFLFIVYHIKQHDNGFARIIHPDKLQFVKAKDLRSIGFYIAGATANHVYFGNPYQPWQLLETDYFFSLIKEHDLDFALQNTLQGKPIRVEVDSPLVFLTAGSQQMIMKTTLPGLGDTISWKNSSRFNLFLALSDHKYITRNLDSSFQQNILRKCSDDGIVTANNYFLLHKQGDGFFSTDGMMRFDKKSGKIFYVYRYTHEIDCLDTNLHLISKGETIDTISFPEFKLGHITSEEKLTFASPPLYVNKGFNIFDGFLFVHSALKASTDDERQFRENAIIDVYDDDKLEYLYSFLIPDYGGEKLHDLRIDHSTLIALYDHFVCSYHLH